MINIAIYSQKKDENTLNYLRDFIHLLENKGIKVFLYTALKQTDFFPKETLTFETKHDLQQNDIQHFFSFGGDGTILSALTIIQDLEIPIIGVNLGRLGFLVGFSQENILENLEKIFGNQLRLSRRSVIEVISPNNKIDFPYALNDVNITRKETTSMITVEAEINGNFLSTFWGDGLIVATPSGSTAYSLSCGGPIIEPDNQNFTLTPIAPHNLNMRPIILNDNVEIKLKVSSRVPKFSLGLDSRLYHFCTDDELILRKAKFNLCLVFPEQNNFYEALRLKLLWGNDRRN